MNAKTALTVHDAAELTPWSVDTIRRAVRATSAVDKNGMPTFPPPLKAKRGPRGQVVILRRDLDAWLDSLPDA